MPLIVLLTASARGVDMESEYRTEIHAIRRDVDALEDAWVRLAGWLPKSEPVAVADIVLKRALSGNDLRVRVFKVGDHCVRARAWAPEWNNEEHAVDPTGMTWSGVAITGNVHVRLHFDGVVPLEGKPLNAWFKIDAKVEGGTLTGSYTSFDPPNQKREIESVRGDLAGTTLSVATAIQQPARSASPKMDRWGADQGLLTAQRLAQQAESAYQAIRALVIAATTGTRHVDAMRYVPTVDLWLDPYVPPKNATRKQPSKGKAPSLDDLGEGLDLKEPADDVLGSMAASDTNSAPVTPGALAGVRQLRRRVGDQLQVALAREKAGHDPSTALPPPVQDPADPMFHPWHETVDPLALEGDIHVLPVDAGRAGKQHWAPLHRWKFIGPFPVGEWRDYAAAPAKDPSAALIPWVTVTPGLPAVVLDANSRFRADAFPGPGATSRFKGADPIEWKPIATYDTFGGVAFPFQANRNPYYGQHRMPPGSDKGHTGMDFGAYIAEAELKAAADTTVWAAVGIHPRGMLWLNDQLIWAGPSDWERHWMVDGRPSPPDHKAEHVSLVKLPLTKGVNRIRIRCEAGYASQFFCVRLCTRGGPSDPAVSEGFIQRAAAASAKLSPVGTGFGLRGDGTGVFDAQPPVAWDLRERHNIAWYRALPYWSNASPVIAPDRLFVMVEPDRLVCLSKADGSVLWERPCSAIDTLPETERAAGRALYDAWWTARQKRDAIPARVLKPDKWIAGSHVYYWNTADTPALAQDEREGASDELRALLDKRDALIASSDVTAIQDDLNKVIDQIEKLKSSAHAGDPAAAEARQAQADLGAAWDKLIRFMKEKFGVSGPEGYWHDLDGYQFATPVTDGRHVWVKTGFGALACFDMAGNKKFLVAHGGLGSGSATISSPLLIDGKIVMLLRRATAESKRGDWQLVAFDATTGGELWATPCRAAAWGACSPAAMRLSNGQEEMTVVITSAGQLIRADDGRLLVSSMQAATDTASIVVRRDLVVFTGTPPMTAFRPLMVDRDTVGFRPLWRRGDNAQYGSGGVADDILFVHGAARFHNGPKERWAGMRRYRVADGVWLDSVALMRKGGNFWSIPTVSRDCIYFYGGDSMFSDAGNKQPMSMAVVEKGADGDLLAVNAVERSYSAAVMEADRLYMRGYQGVWCVAHTGDEGRAYEARHVAETLLDQIPTRRPKDSPAKPTGPATAGGAHVRTKLDHGLAPATWHYSGPHAAGQRPSIGQECSDTNRWKDRGTWAAGTGWKLTPFNAKNLTGALAPNWLVDSENFTLIDRQRQRVVDLGRAVKLTPGAVHYLYAELENDRDRVAQFECDTPGVKAWVNQTPVASGETCRLPKGIVSLLVEVTVDHAHMAEGCLLSPCFWDVDDPKSAGQRWVDFVGRHRSRLQRAIELAPNSAEARRSKAVLDQL